MSLRASQRIKRSKIVRMSRVIFVLIISFILEPIDCHGFLEDQPKFLTEDGNFVIESAIDRNITFRLMGRSCIKVNDLNIMNLINPTGNVTLPTNIGRRLSQLETRVNSLNSRGPNRAILNRLTRVENRVRNLTADFRYAAINRRLRGLENRINAFLSSLNSNNCTSDPCKNGGTCIDAINGYLCRCPDAWTGESCDQDVNECANFAGTDLGCQNGATCTNTIGSYTCSCLPGWVGIHCTRRSVDCLASSSTDLCDKGTCVHTNDALGYRCICNQGWTTNNVTPACSVDVDECQSAQPHCSMDPEVMCINLPGTYMCGHCPPGFSGNGHYCRDINECEINNGGCSVAPMVTCTNTRGSSHCGNCPMGYAGDGRVCIRTSGTRDPTIAANPDCANCHPLARCMRGIFGQVQCVCLPLYTGSGFGPGGCTRLNATFDLCSHGPCQNGGTCLNIGISSFVCQCPPGTMRPLCALPNANPCTASPCRNGGTCVSAPATPLRFQCTCPPSHSGIYCQNTVRQCGGAINSESGTLKYPLSDSYPHNSHCAWLIRTNASLVLNVTFTKFNLEMSHECRFDWLQIHDGRSSASYVIGRFCGDRFPKGGNIISTQNMLYFWFRSDNSSSNEGFELNWTSIPPVCGGEIEATSHGTIASPGSPGNYPPNRDCLWHVQAPNGKRIQMQFYTMQLEEHSTCQYDYLAIYNGPTTSDELLEKFCNTSHPAPLTTPSNEVTLHFHSDADLNDAGFQIHYQVIEGVPGCGGTYTSDSGQFATPLQNGVYMHNLLCHYLIRLPPNSRIKIQFPTFVLESSSSCTFDYLEIFEGATETAPKVGRWCGTNVPPQYESLGNELLIVFKSDWSSSHEGFTAQYDVVCGGKFEDNNGTVMSPLYPNTYKASRKCDYYIEAPMGKAIKLDFSDFDIEDNSGGTCDFDFLEVYDGTVSDSTKLGRFCGESNPASVMSTMNYMHLVFQTDSSVGGRGFKGNYSFEDVGCGGILTRLGQTITSPSESDGGYQHNAKCSWIIIAPKNHIVQLTFTSFHLEAGNECAYDSVTVFSGYVTMTTTDSATSMGKYCGSSLPPVLQSGSNIVSIVFRSDDSLNANGFTATYNFVDAHNLCGGTLYAATGTITSPGYPNLYSPSKECIWILNAPTGKQVELIVKSFELEESSQCDFDFLEIRNGATDKSPLIGTYCGTDILPRIKSFSNQMYVRFKTDSTRELKGFEIDYDSTSSGCGGVFSNTQRGSVTSPNYPEPYGGNMQCEWRISVSAGSTVTIFISDMEMEEHGTCNFDYLEIFDGTDASAKSFGKYCDSDHPLQFESTTNNVFLRFRSDYSMQGRGFDLKFNTNCRREIRDIRGVIESPNYPSPYPHNTRCEWKVVPLAGNKLYMEFSSFEMEYLGPDSPDPCQFDHLIIEERDSSDAIVRSNKYCEKKPAAFTTPNTVILRFETDFSHAEHGFHLEFESVGCGGLLTKPEGVIQTPNYPQPYPHNTKCQWSIEVDYGHLIEITFRDFDFEATSDECRQDGVIISNEWNDTKPILHICSSIHQTPQIVTSYRNKVFVNFYSDVSYAGRGFMATYRSVPLKCGGLFTASKGRIVSPNYPKNYEANSYCEYLIRTEPSHALDLKFTDFDLETTTDCTDDYVEVYDGHEKLPSQLLLNRTCGSQLPNDTIRGESNELLVIFQSDFHIEAKGWAAEFETACGAKINTSSSGIIEIGHNLRWSVKNCGWVIRANDPNQHVSLSVMHIENEPIFQQYMSANETREKCLRTIEIYDGPSIEGPKLLEICSSKHPPTVISSGNALTIHLSNVSFYDLGFTFELKAYYTVFENECGGTFESISGQLASPAYPRSYPNNIECEWTITASPGNLMSLTIEMIDIDLSDQCNDDYLEVREQNKSGNVLGVFCGKNVPPPIKSATKYWLKFRSNNDGVGLGFKLEYNYARHVEQTGKSGVITSPLYPSFIYYTIDSYTYRITVENNHVISLTFADDLILKRDTVIDIIDGYDDESPALLKFDRENMPDMKTPIQSTTNIVFIRFRIELFSETKFKLNWVQIAADSIKTNLTNSLNCSDSSSMEVDSREILGVHSPGFPYGYESPSKCVWNFYASHQGFHVAMQFNTVDLEQLGDCVTDYVSVESSNDMAHFTPLAKLCAPVNASRQQYQGAPHLRVQFVADYYNNRTGFDATVYLMCGGRYTTPDGEISKATIDRKSTTLVADVSRVCEWIVEVRRGRTIQFNFTTLNLVMKQDGSCNGYVLIRNGPNEDSPFLGAGKYCGSNKDVVIERTSGNVAYVQYVTSIMEYPNDDFVLRYQQMEHDCGGYFTLTPSWNSTIVATPNYPNIPNAHIECVWRVTAPSGHLLQVEVIDRFDLTVTPNCDTEYLELREGSAAMAPLIGRYCKPIDHKIFTRSNSLRLHFFTDVSVPRNGFKLNVSLALCGRSLTATNGYITSPGYPAVGTYPLNEACEYYITGKSMTSLNITFLDLDLPYAETDNCNDTDHVVVSAYTRDAFGNVTLSDLRYVCGMEPPAPILTGSSRVLIKFVTKNKRYERRGFRIFFNSTSTPCGGYVNAEAARIESPGYPLLSIVPLYCEWFITVPKGRRVTVRIIDLDMADVNQQSYIVHRFVRMRGPRFQLLTQGLTFYNDFGYQSRIKHIGMSNETTELIKSTDNKMLINAGLTEGDSRRGFRLEFSSVEESVCDGNLDQDEGSFETPAIFNQSYYCEYRRSPELPLSQNGVATLSVKVSMDTNGPAGTMCTPNTQSGIEFYYRDTARRAIMMRCPPKFNNIATPYAGARLVARRTFFPIRYRFSYKIHSCGSVIDALSTTTNVSQPTMPANYGELDCAWVYGSPMNQRIQFIVDITDFNCENEYLNIYNGQSPMGPNLLHACGTATVTKPFLVSGSHLFIEYHTDNYNASSRFQVSLTASDGICGGIVEQPNYSFSSPKSGTKYLPDSHCEWIIRVHSGFHIGLAFVDRFMIESSENCTKDYVEVFDNVSGGVEYKWKSMGRYCGRNVPPFRNSTGTEMKILFHSDSSGDGDGFSVQWTETCGGIFRATNEIQYITSPRYPEKYLPNLNCNYTILADENQQISIKFLDFELEDTSRACRYDNVTIYRQTSFAYPPSTETIGVYCWDDSLKTAIRYPDRFEIIFQTDKWYEKKGFKFQYHTDICGGTITQPGIIQTPLDEVTNTYVSESKCVWNITAPADKRIVIRFEEFELESNSGCYSDYVDVYEGLALTDNMRKARICGNLTHIAPAIPIASNKATVRFASDSSIHYKGFRAAIIFAKNCDHVVNLTAANPTYTLNELHSTYEALLDCHYLFIAPPGYVVQMKFNQFHLAPCVNDTNVCKCDYLTVRDGNGPFAEAIGTYCGHTNPNDVITSTGSLWLRFSTDGAVESTGFSATIQAVRAVCGEQYRKISDSNTIIEIESPNDGRTYLPNLNCLWEIDVTDYRILDVKFERFDLQGPNNDKQCTADYLEIQNLADQYGPYISEGLGENVIFSGQAPNMKTSYFYMGKSWPVATHTYCGNSTPMDYYSTGKIAIRFKTDESIQRSGFKLTAKALRDCERNHTRLQGRLLANVATMCESFINVPENYTISFYFATFEYHSTVCTTEDAPLLIYDGKTGQFIEKACGNGLPNPLFTNTNSLKLKFKTGEISYGLLYDITYIASNQGRGCGGEVFNYGGVISSPGYPNTDKNDSDCTWVINVPQSLRVALRFDVFDLGPSRLCDSNYVELIEADDGESVRKFCGADKIAPYKGKSNTLSVRFKSGKNFAGTGWLLHFMAVHEESQIDNY